MSGSGRFGVVFLAVLPVVVASAGCLPDMAVHDQQLTWSAGARRTTAVITNRGARATGPFAVILTAEDCSSTLRWKNRARVFREVGSLEPGASATVAADFAGAGNEPNGFLADVSAVSCIADFNRLVPEGNEYNNVARLPTYSVAGLADHTYNEMLGTILRGILVREPFASPSAEGYAVSEALGP